MRFIGLRHGQSTYNLTRLCNDDPMQPVHLTALGRAQAEAAAQVLLGESLTAIHCSVLPRAKETAQIINQTLQLPLCFTSALADIRSGCEGQPVTDYLSAITHDPVDGRVAGGESLREYYARVSGYLQSLVETHADNLLLVAHEETLRMFKAWAQRLPLEQVVGLAFENALPYHFIR